MQGLVLKTIHCPKCDKHVKPKLEVEKDEKGQASVLTTCTQCGEILKTDTGPRFGAGFGTLSE